MSDPRAKALLEYWFAPGMEPRWFAADADLARDLAERFGAVLAEAAAGQLTHWLDDGDDALALIVLLAQIPRHVFRGKYQAYAFDSKALAVAEAALLSGHHLGRPARQRRFFYLPFQHSESLPDQKYGLSLYEADDDAEGAEFARRHLAEIERFGRFPGRNAVLEREDTTAEVEFLATGGGVS